LAWNSTVVRDSGNGEDEWQWDKRGNARDRSSRDWVVGHCEWGRLIPVVDDAQWNEGL